MNPSVSLEDLCRPVLTCFCNYWQLNQAGTPPSLEKFRADIESSLEEAKHNAAADPVLIREYERIERPLVFFIDFMVQESTFPFNRNWRELGRNYNELSGDEKFFNLLSDALKDKEAIQRIPLFYAMLGLGFEGAYMHDHGYIDKLMNQCVAQFPGELDIREEPIVEVVTEQRIARSKKARFLRPLRMTLILSILFLVFSLIFNFSVFFKVTHPFREHLSGAAVQARDIKTIPYEVP
ncbi:MAG: DotU family type IV/VI secretion system protein [Treponema sp.]|jgi:type IV/VI secretion system ImpK/VasF family protein|nr:DotU family type IV/VI secretion system protein [Treponema sp.]